MNKQSIYLFFVVFLLFPFSLMAQNEEWEKHRIKFTPTRMVNLFYPGLELGYEYCNGNFSSQLSAAYLLNFFNSYNSLNGYHVKFEEKYFFKRQPSNNRVKIYLSAEINYNYAKLNQNLMFSTTEYEQSDLWEHGEYEYSGNFDLKRKSIVTNLKMGTQIRFRKIIFEPCAGIGIGFQNVVLYNKRHPDDILLNSECFTIYNLTDKEGFSILPNFTMSFRIGYMF